MRSDSLSMKKTVFYSLGWLIAIFAVANNFHLHKNVIAPLEWDKQHAVDGLLSAGKAVGRRS